MLGLYTPLLILQGICLYHAYRTRAEQRWYWAIIFIPVVGCILYIFYNIISGRNVQAVTRTIQQAVNSNYRIEHLEKQLRFVDNVANKINLADAYMAADRCAEALTLYQQCLNDMFMADDPALQMKALQAAYGSGNMELAIRYGGALENEKSFRNAEARIAYAWAFHRTGQTAKALTIFKDLDKSFTNYPHRVAYAKLLEELNDAESLRTLVGELLDEFSHMKGPERRYHQAVIYRVKEMARRPAQV